MNETDIEDTTTTADLEVASTSESPSLAPSESDVNRPEQFLTLDPNTSKTISDSQSNLSKNRESEKICSEVSEQANEFTKTEFESPATMSKKVIY